MREERNTYLMQAKNAHDLEQLDEPKNTNEAQYAEATVGRARARLVFKCMAIASVKCEREDHVYGEA